MRLSTNGPPGSSANANARNKWMPAVGVCAVMVLLTDTAVVRDTATGLLRVSRVPTAVIQPAQLHSRGLRTAIARRLANGASRQPAVTVLHRRAPKDLSSVLNFMRSPVSALL